MTTKLDRPLKREILINEKAFTLTIDADGLKLVEKGRRNGESLTWKSIVAGSESSGDAAGDDSAE
jgi:hypothetical protein